MFGLPEQTGQQAARLPPLSGEESVEEFSKRRDWSDTPLGPRGEWPPSLLSAFDICMASLFPCVIYWGPQSVCLFNQVFNMCRCYTDVFLPLKQKTKKTQSLGVGMAQRGVGWAVSVSRVGPTWRNCVARGLACIGADVDER